MYPYNLVTFAGMLAAGVAFGAGTISGTIEYTGPAPKPATYNTKSDAFCAKQVIADPTVTLSKDGKGLANVLVRLTNAPASAPPQSPVIVDQVGCMYTPRVQGAVLGQKIAIRNSDGTLHNVHAYTGTKTLFNQAQPPKARELVKDAKSPEVVKLKCDVHTWMVGYVVVGKNGFFTTSGADGRFELPAVPPGKYTVEAWHEKFGIRTAEVTVVDGQAVDPKFSFGS